MRINEKFRISYRVFCRVPAEGLLSIKPAELMLFFTGTDSELALLGKPQNFGNSVLVENLYRKLAVLRESHAAGVSPGQEEADQLANAKAVARS